MEKQLEERRKRFNITSPTLPSPAVEAPKKPMPPAKPLPAKGGFRNMSQSDREVLLNRMKRFGLQ